MSEEELEISRSLDLAEFCVEPAFPATLARSRSAERGIPPPANSATPRWSGSSATFRTIWAHC